MTCSAGQNDAGSVLFDLRIDRGSDVHGHLDMLGALLPNYDPITQTISEMGERGSPFEIAFKAVNLFVAGCFVLFAFGVYRFSKERRVSLLPAVLLDFLPLWKWAYLFLNLRIPGTICLGFAAYWAFLPLSHLQSLGPNAPT